MVTYGYVENATNASARAMTVVKALSAIDISKKWTGRTVRVAQQHLGELEADAQSLSLSMADVCRTSIYPAMTAIS